MKTLEEKLSQLPEPVRERVLYDLNVPRILEALSVRENLINPICVCVHYKANKNVKEAFDLFAPEKSIFGFAYHDIKNPYNPELEVNITRIYFNYFDCLELLKIHYESLENKIQRKPWR